VSKTPTCHVDYLRANFTPFYLLANLRGIVSTAYKTQPNWVIAMRLFAVGSTSARAICRDAGIDPDSTEVRPTASQESADKEPR
jgi:hypothetical protein